MDDYGIDCKGTIKIQSVATLPAFVSEAADKRRLIYCEDTEKFYFGTSTGWALLFTWDGATVIAPAFDTVP